MTTIASALDVLSIGTPQQFRHLTVFPLVHPSPRAPFYLTLDEALAQGRGVILLTAHLGNWEIGGLGLRALGHAVTVVTLKHNSAFTNQLVNTMRGRHGIRVVRAWGFGL